MPEIKLIACDLDGTLLLNGAQSLQPDTCDLIQMLHEKGILFFAASGRQYTNLQRLFAPIKDKIGYLCENGCISFFHGKQLHKEIMQRELGQEIIREIMQHDETEVSVSDVMHCYIQPKKMSFYHHLNDVVKYDVRIVPDILATSEDYMKISIYEYPFITNKDYWQKKFCERCTVVTSGNEWLDMMPKGVNKGSALLKVLSSLNISPNECMAIGDNDNDIEMLKLAGFPVAVKSAKPEIRAIARFETNTVENLFRRILNNEKLSERTDL